MNESNFNEAYRKGAPLDNGPTDVQQAYPANNSPRKLTLPQALRMTLIYHWHNLAEELLADIFKISQPTVSRTICLIEHALAKVSRACCETTE